MATETKIQKQRSGNLSDLPILLAGELGYALDAKRLFIGNANVSLDADGVATEFNFGVDFTIIDKNKIFIFYFFNIY